MERRRIVAAAVLLGWTVAVFFLWTPPARAAEPPVRILPLGDSITQGGGEHPSYRPSLQQKLSKAGWKFDFVGSQKALRWGDRELAGFDPDHEGHWGWSTADILDRIDEWAVAAKADIVLLHLGTNDLRLPEDDTAANLARIIASLRRANPRVAVLVAKIIPCTCGPDEKVRATNETIQKMALARSRTDSPIVVVDHFTGFDAATDTYDGAHPNEAGEEKMAERWFEALQKLRASVPIS